MPEIDLTDNYPELFNSPALHISNIVRGRENIEGRVYYYEPRDIDRGEVINKAIPEEVVLYRWRRRIFNGLSFKGFRLSPNIWRSVGKVLGRDAKLISELNEESIQRKYNEAQLALREHNYPSPAASNLKLLFKAIKVGQLQLILDRHLDPDRINRYGTPDLFLFALNPVTNQVSTVRFVEVKRPEEPLSIDQAEEMRFLRYIGLKARVLRLIEG